MVKHDLGYTYSRPGRFRRYSDIVLPVLVLLGAMVLFLRTMAPSVFWGDSAAFATSNSILGLPHSPSFPLYTMLGRLFNLIPHMDPAFASNLMSAFFAALSVMVFFLLIKQMAEVPIIQASRKKTFLAERPIILSRTDAENQLQIVEVDNISKPAAVILPCLVATALYAISLPVWLSGVRAEVYSLHLFLTLLSVWISFIGITKGRKRIFFLGVWLYALTFANHPLLAMAFAPAFLYLIIANFSGIGFRPAVVTLVLLFFAMSFSIYFYLPIRSSLDPAINWGRPDSLESFVVALTRSSDMANFSQLTVAPDYLLRLRKIGDFMAGQIGWPLIGLTLVGLWGAFKVSRKLFFFFPLAIIFNLAIVLWAADFNPRNYDLVNYLAPLTALILMVSVAGVLYLLRTRIVAGQASFLMAVLVGVFIYLNAGSNYAKADFSKVNGPEILSSEITRGLPAGTLVIVAEDDVILPLWYYSYVESSAARLNIISAGAMINPQYRKQLTVHNPALIYPPGFINESSVKPDSLVAALCRLNAPKRDVYIQFGVPGIEAAQVEPSGILFKYNGGNGQAKIDKESLKPHLELTQRLLLGNQQEIQVIEFCGRWLFNTAIYYERMNSPELAWQLFNQALNVDKGNVDMRVRLAAALARAGKYKEALQYISQALEIDPNDKNSLELGRHIVKALEKSGTVAAND